ncbi:PZF1 (YPR186C) [Zygosaccharomyces parabailii]|nr:PZF1 (YPR186C) [Zygosaccharomyces parabailii]CDH10539.1 related to Transcription factor IIIA [Zygosaccharomyces bailii ISA1307]
MIQNGQTLELDLKLWQNSKPELESAPASPQSVRSVSSLSSTNSRPKTYFCDYDGCGKAFARPSSLTEHQNAIHRGLRPFPCNQCSKSFTRKIHLERHLCLHTGERPYHCSVCGKGTVTLQHLRRHEITHTKSFKCPYPDCNEAFYRHPTLRSHILTVHRKLICESCNKEFKTPSSLKHHNMRFHNPNCLNPYQCSFTSCLNGFKTWSALQTHIKKDHPKLPCSICNKLCVGEEGLHMHMRVHDDSLVAKNWKCNYCKNVMFAKKSDLIDHHEKMHGDKLPIPVIQFQDVSHESINEDVPQKLKKQKISRLSNSCKQLEDYFAQGKSGLDLLLNTAGRKRKCCYDKCYRTFKTEERYQQHIEKHKIHELKLKILEDFKMKNEESACLGLEKTNNISKSDKAKEKFGTDTVEHNGGTEEGKILD